MTVILQVTDETTTVDFENSTGPELADLYLPVFSGPNADGTIPPDVTEAVPVLIRIASDDGLAATLQDIARLQWQAKRYMSDPVHQKPVWFRRKLTGETGATASGVRFLVKSMLFTPNAQFGGLFDKGPAITDGRVGVVSITHHPYGESVAATAASGTDNVSVLGGASTHPTVTGDVPARLYYLGVDDIAAANTYREYWFGFRSVNTATTPANFVSLWECEAGTEGVDTTRTTDATASPGGGGNTKQVCAFAGTTTWASRTNQTLLVATGGANYADQYGQFIVLLRAKVSTGTAQVKLSQGVYATNNRFGPVVDVSATSYTLYNLGVAQFPTRDLHGVPVAMYAASYDQLNVLDIWARVKPGADTPNPLSLDCMILIPCDEFFIHVQNADTSLVSPDEMRVSVSPEDVATSYEIATGASSISLQQAVSVIGTGVPVGANGRLFVCAAQGPDGLAPSSLTADMDIAVSPILRWLYFRGAE